ncbi:tRNA pseudouridine(38-40) synthase TruA [uncultured Methylobacterium sp.]|jgi:tRNA pseudouridine38-40 synthase|uniref:tRNA pseudouridine(38-40) synthase TruA n=1 Tax=uncultured Methylobacterium sp. TaxID=157278 RepID=UPI00262D1AB8|nr:tRNA pseudouridine(38-40) synthase TruA [uncultured Methylobacterium sp.]
MPRYKLVVEYDGTAFAGWQRQATHRSVQQALEEAIARFVSAPVRVHCAGRTDAGVHATHQVVHLDLDRDWRTDTVRDAANAHLRPEPVAVVAAEVVGADFDARHSAVKRHYRYRILNRRSPPALDRAQLWHVPWALDAALMHEAAQGLLGRHDFSAFRAAECQANSPVRTLDRLDVARSGDEIVVLTAARSFLHHQVRGMVGTLMLAGGRRLTPAGVRAVLDSRDRTRCGPLAPSAGLTLIGVDYPDRPEVARASQDP